MDDIVTYKDIRYPLQQMHRVYGKGFNLMKQMGKQQTTLLLTYQPVYEMDLRKVKTMKTGIFQSYFALEDGQIVYMGYSLPHRYTGKVHNYYKRFPWLVAQWQSMTQGTLNKKWSLTDYSEEPILLNKEGMDRRHKILKFDACEDSLFYLHNGTVFAMGENGRGQLGTGSENYEPTFKEVTLSFKEPTVDFSCGGSYTVFASDSGKVFGSGDASHFVLEKPLEGRDGYWRPRLITDRYKIVKTAAGPNHSIFLERNNKLYGYGSNQYGQCGGDDASLKQLTEIPCFFGKYEQIKDIKAGSNHTLILTDKRVYFLGSTSNSQYPFRQDISTSNTNINSPHIIPVEGKPLKIFASYDRSAILTDKNTVYLFGGGKFQKGDVETIQDEIIGPDSEVALGLYHTLIST